jgi:hypothetical protein
MGFFPRLWLAPHVISTAGECGLGSWSKGGGGTNAWGTANRAFYCPIVLPAPVVAKRLFMLVGTTQNGNVDVGIYNHAGAKIVSSGSVAQGPVSAVQIFDIADTPLPAGNYYMAVSSDSTTATFGGVTLPNGAMARAVGASIMATAFPLPSTLTFGTTAPVAVPLLGFEVGRLV